MMSRNLLLNLYEEPNLNLMKPEIKKLHICSVAKINRSFFLSKQIYTKLQSTAIAQ